MDGYDEIRLDNDVILRVKGKIKKVEVTDINCNTVNILYWGDVRIQKENILKFNLLKMK